MLGISRVITINKHNIIITLELKSGQKVAKWPNLFLEAKQEKKKLNSSYLASKRPIWQPWIQTTRRRTCGQRQRRHRESFVIDIQLCSQFLFITYTLTKELFGCIIYV